MTEKELLYLKTVADEGSISKAAEKLYITQPSLSHCIQRIEEVLGTRLFIRNAKGMSLTYAGERYYSVATEILRLYGDFEIEISEIGDLKKGRITLGTNNFLGTWILPEVLPEFNRFYPNIHVALREMTSNELEKALELRQLDFAVMHVIPGSISKASDDIEYRMVHRDPIVVAAKVGSGYEKLARRSPNGVLPIIDLKKLKDEPFISVAPGQRLREMSDSFFYKIGAAPNTVLTTKSFETARRMAAQGFGFALISWAYAHMIQNQYPTEYYAIEESYMPYWETRVAVPKDYYITNAAQALIETINRKMSDQVPPL